MKLKRLFPMHLLILSTLSYAQDQPSASSQLHLQAKAQTTLTGTLVGKARCDEIGNLYIRFMDTAANGQYHAIAKLPIEEIKPSGQVVGTFKITDAFPEISGKDVFVTPNGTVYQAGYTPDGSVYIVQFASNGQVTSKVRLDATSFTPYQLAVFKSGEFLVSGTLDNDDRTPFTAVFARDGKLIKKIYEPEDEDSRQKAAAGDPKYLPVNTNTGNTFVWHGDSVIGSDGNAYLLRATSPALIYVVSSSGELIRKLHVSGPSGLIARSLRPGKGTLAINFLQDYSIRGIIELVDLEGNILANYSPEDDTTAPGLPGCYVLGNFTFLKNDAEHNVFVHSAELK